MSSVLLCVMDDGIVNLYVDGAAVFIDNVQQTPIDKIANSSLTNERVRDLLAIADKMLAGQIALNK